MNLDFDKDVLPAEEKLISQFGFLKEEVNFIMRYNPKFILLSENQRTRDIGIEAMHKYFVQEKGFELDTVRTLVVIYPYILSKTIEEFKNFFEIMKTQGINEEEAMRALIECPKLISRKELSKQIKEI